MRPDHEPVDPKRSRAESPFSSARRTSMDRLVLAFLGGFRARLESGPSVLVPTKKGQALLAYLACSPTVSHPRDALATLFWGDTAQQHARHSLRQTLFMLRAAFPASVSAILRGDAETISLDATSLVVDVLDFERLAGDSALEALHAASTLYRGDLLVGIPVDDRGFEEWLRAKREQLRELAVEVFTKLLTLQCAAGLTERAIQTALRLLALDPLQEAAHRELMPLYASMARPGAAVRQYRTCAQTLKRELGLEP